MGSIQKLLSFLVITYVSTICLVTNILAIKIKPQATTAQDFETEPEPESLLQILKPQRPQDKVNSLIQSQIMLMDGDEGLKGW